MGTKTWTGSAGDNKFETSGNWSPASTPTTGDDVVMGGTSNANCVLRGDTAVLRSFDMTGYSGSITAFGGNWVLNIGGASAANTKLGSGFSNLMSLKFSHTVTGINYYPNGCTSNLTFDGVGGGWTFQTSTITDGGGHQPAVTLENGTLDTGGFDMAWSVFIHSTTGTATLNLNGSTISLPAGRSGNTWRVAAAGLTVNAGTSTIAFTCTSTLNDQGFQGGGTLGSPMVYYNVSYHSTASDAGFVIDGYNSFYNLTFSADTAKTLTFTNGTTNVFRNSFNVIGSSGKVITLTNSVTTAGAQHYLSFPGAGHVSCDYLSISHSNVAQTNTWYAGANSTDGGNNTNWVFTTPPGNSQLMLTGVGN